MTKEELRKIFDEAEKEICTPELVAKVKSELTGSEKFPAENRCEFAIRVNRVLDREILLEVLSRVLGT